MANAIKIKRGLKINLPTLSVGEMGYCTDTKEIYIGTATGNELLNGGGATTDLSNIVKPVTGDYIKPQAFTFTTLALASQRVYYVPIYIYESTIINGTAIQVTTASATAGQTVSVGLYSSDTNGKPYQFLQSFSNPLVTSIAVVTTSISNYTIPAGLYYLAVRSTHTSNPTLRAVATSPFFIPTSSTATLNTFHAGYIQSSQATFPATATPSVTGPVPNIILLKA